MLYIFQWHTITMVITTTTIITVPRKKKRCAIVCGEWLANWVPSRE